MSKIIDSVRRWFSPSSRAGKSFAGAWIVALWDSWRSSFWFIPSIATALAIVAGLGLPVLDHKVGDQVLEMLPWIETTSSASRTTIAAMAGALFTVTGVIFSVTMVTLSLTTSQFGPRLLRTFTDNSISQFTLGVFLGTSVYCLLVLRAVRTVEGDVFVPHISTAVGVLASVFSMILLIVFIQFVANSIQAQNVIREVAWDLTYAIKTLYPERIGEGELLDQPSDGADPGSLFDDSSAASICCDQEGYLQGIDLDAVLELAHRHDLRIRISTRPGEFVTDGITIFQVAADSIPKGVRAKLLETLVVGVYRTPRQDLLCAVDELVEVAVRALSPGINDPFTAIACIDSLSGCLHRLAGRKVQSPYRYDKEGNVRVLVRQVTFPEAVASSFDLIRNYGVDCPAVLIRLLEAFRLIGKACHREEDTAALRQQAENIWNSAERCVDSEYDLNRIREAYESTLFMLNLSIETMCE